MWGKASLHGYECGGGRIIPTHVGKSLDVLTAGRIARDHPHACGEKVVLEVRR